MTYAGTHEIPEHYVSMVLVNVPPPPGRDPFNRPPEFLIARQQDVFRRLLQVIWADAFQQGMKTGLSVATETKWMVVTPEERDHLVASLKPKEE